MPSPARTNLGTVLIAAMAVALVATPARAGEPAGVIKRLEGDVVLQRGDQPLRPTLGQAVQVGDLVRTGRDGTAAITLADDTLLSAGPNSALAITEFSFNPTTHEGGMLLSVWRGAVAVVTGLLAKKAPEKVNVQTRTVVLGVRGTEFIVDAGEGR